MALNKEIIEQVDEIIKAVNKRNGYKEQEGARAREAAEAVNAEFTKLDRLVNEFAADEASRAVRKAKKDWEKQSVVL
jgi:molybdenum-dependent DNA-binding transcriptional regulator ModE